MLDIDSKVAELGREFSDSTIALHESIARSANLTGTDHKYLGMLIKGGPMTAGDLARRSGLTTGAVTGVIDRLEKQQLVKREFIKDDRRKVIIVADTVLTDKLLGPVYKILKKEIVGLVNTFSDQEKAVIEKYLTSAIKVMKQVTSAIDSVG